MNENAQDKAALLTTIFDVIPSFVFLVDNDVRIQAFNKAAAGLFPEKDKTAVLLKRGGEALHCLHSTEVNEGCGRAPYCKNCVVRNSVKEAFKGATVTRRRTKMELSVDGKTTEIYALVTAVPFEFDRKTMALLIIEDISELMELKKLIPICCRCKKIRNDKDYWTQLEDYFKTHLDLDFTHSYCPDCLKKELRENAA